MERFKIKSLLLFSFGLLVLLMSVISALSIHGTSELAALTNKIYIHPFTVSNSAKVLRANINSDWNTANAIADGKIAGSDILATKAVMDKNCQEAYKLTTLIRERYLGDKSDIDEVYRAHRVIDEHINNAIEAALHGNLKQAQAILHQNDSSAAFALLNENLNDIEKFSNSKAQKFILEASSISNETTLLVKLALLIFTLITLASVALLIRHLKRQFEALKKVFSAVAVGEYVKYDKEIYHNEIGMLATSLNAMVDKLQENKEHAERQIWLKEMLNALSKEVAGKGELKELSRLSVDFMSSSVGAGAAALYILDETEGVLRLSAGFGVNSSIKKSFQIGEGIVGQVAIDRVPIFQKNIPNDGVCILTALSDKIAINSYLYPISFDEKLLGVVEFASHTELAPLQQEFLELAIKASAASISLAMQSQKVTEALELADKANKELKEQSDEIMRINAKMEEQQQSLEEANATLEEQQQSLEEANATLEEQHQQININSREIKEKNEHLAALLDSVESKNRELEEASRYKNEFLANVSHELRTPLNSIILLSGLLHSNKDGNLSEDDIKKLSVINSSGGDLLRLINDILDLSKIEAKRMELRLDTIHSSEFCEYVEGMFAEEAKQKGLELKITDSIKGNIVQDSDKLGQIVKNLMSNAIKFTKEGFVEFKIFKEQDGLINVSVKDSGIGIEKDKQQLVFDAFSQADGSISREFGGTGLGLAITKEMAALMGGEIKLTSELGVGSEFVLTLPDKAQKDQKDDTAQIPIDDDRAALNKDEKALLVVEDDYNFATLLVQKVRDEGIKVITSQTGSEAMGFIKKGVVLGALVDVGLPDMNGLDIIKQLKSSAIPVYAMSGMEKERLAGLDKLKEFLQKPISDNVLTEAIKELACAKDRRKNILIADTNGMDRAHIKDSLKNFDLKVHEAGDEMEVKTLLGKTEMAICIVDVALCNSGEDNICKYIHEQKPLTKLIVLSAEELGIEKAEQLEKYTDSIVMKKSDLYLQRVAGDIASFIKNISMPAAVATKKEHPAQKMFIGKKTLLVDDDVRNLYSMSAILERYGMDVVTAKNGKEALERLKENSDIDIVLMDIMMPVMDGMAAIKEIRKMSEYSGLPIIAATAKAQAEDRAQCIEAGANDYIAKPVNTDLLTGMIALWLNQK